MEEKPVVPFFSLEGRRAETDGEVRAALNAVWESDSFIGGKYVEEFEHSYAEFIGVQHCVGVGNGLDALRIILLAAGIGPGDEVIVPAHTFIATWLAVIQTGATPIPVDVLIDSGNIDSDLVEAAISPRTAAVIAVHLYGLPADMNRLTKICERNSLLLVEDAAQAHGAKVGESLAGALGNAAAFSFYPTKNLGALGDAGCVTTNDGELAAKARSLRSYGVSKGTKYLHEYPGWNSRMDPIQAAALQVFLRHLDVWNSRRSDIAQLYSEALSLPNASKIIPSQLQFPRVGEDSAWHHFVVISADRSHFRETLKQQGVMTDIHYPHPAYKSEAVLNRSQRYKSPDYEMPVSDFLATSVVSLPMHPWLGNDSHRVMNAMKTYRSL